MIGVGFAFGVLLGCAIGWLLHSVASGRPVETATSAGDKVELEFLRSRLVELESVLEGHAHAPEDLTHMLAHTQASLIVARHERDAAEKARMAEIAKITEERYSFPPTSPKPDLAAAIEAAARGEEVDATAIKATPVPLPYRTPQPEPEDG